MIRNKIHIANTSEINELKRSIMKNNNIRLVEISGNTISSWEEYAAELERQLKFPTSCIRSVDIYLDWIQDLSWIDENELIIIIYDFDRFIESNPSLKNEIISDFEEVILPFWESEVEKCVVGGKAKSFNVYLANE